MNFITWFLVCLLLSLSYVSSFVLPSQLRDIEYTILVKEYGQNTTDKILFVINLAVVVLAAIVFFLVSSAVYWVIQYFFF